MEMQSLMAERSVDALRFLKRATSLLDAVVLIKMHNGATMFNGLHITPELVVALRGDTNVAGVDVTINDATASVAWASAGDTLLLRTTVYEGALPDLSLAPYQAQVAIVWMNVAGEARLGFGRTGPDAKHDAPTEAGSMGAPLFDDAWQVIGLARTRDTQGIGGYVPINDLLRELESSPCWDEIASVHRLVRSTSKETKEPDAPVAPDLARAVRWTKDGNGNPMSERDRRRAVAGKSPAELRLARGDDPATTPEQRAVDAILAGAPISLEAIDDDILLPFATAVRWFRDVVPGLPDEAALEREVSCRRQTTALAAIVGSHFAPRESESERLRAWLAFRDRAPMVVRGPGGIGKSALLAHFTLQNAKTLRFAWIDFDRPDVSADEASIMRVVEQQLGWQAPQGPLLVVLDSFETAVQTYGYAHLNPALDALASRFEDVAVVVGSRAPVPLLKVQGEPAQEWELSGLPIEVVKRWLEAEGVAPEFSEGIAIVTNGVPLNMKLSLDLVKGKSDDEVREIVASLPKQLVTGYLYRRILRRLRDGKLREQAQWAMVPRRLVADLLAAILHVSIEESERLFAALRSELTLLEGDAVLTVRADLRNTLLPLLEAEDAARVREIDSIAADFWAARASDDTSAAEAVYHALRLGEAERAQQLWRSGVARHLGAYAMDELPYPSQAWLEARLSRESADQAAEDLLSVGDIAQAAATLSVSSRGVSTLQGRKRGLAVQELAAKSNLEATPESVGNLSLEAIVIGSSRPAIRVRDGTFEIEFGPWAHLEGQRSQLQNAIAAVGRVQLGDGTILGTASLVGPDRFITTRSVVERFSVGSRHNAQLINGREPAIDMRAEGESASQIVAIKRVLLIHPYWDIAIVEAPKPPPRLPLLVATREPVQGADIAVIGHPARNDQEHDLLATIFANVFDVKRLMPGKYAGQQAELSLGRTVSAGLDDATSLSPDMGAPVVDAATGHLLGVRFSWAFLGLSKFVPAWELARDPEIVKAGIAMTGDPLPAPEWASAWRTTVTPSRHTLLDAYVARASGDLERARALLGIVSDDESVKIDRTLLQAACDITVDPVHAADLLHHLVEQSPRDSWTNVDRNAAIATRLRLVVDAEAEREFLKIVEEEPMAAELLEQHHFRVLVPPEKLPWKRPNRTSPGVRGSDSALPFEAAATAQRIVDASHRCLALREWVHSTASEIANLNYLFGRSASDVRELAAAYVAYPFDMVQPITDFLLEKTDLAPHPTQGWAPIVEPLFMMFRNARGLLPQGQESAQDLEGWLDANAKSGRLGSYLTEFLRFDSQVAWQAGLLHLTTELPIESLLKRRFSGVRPS